MIDIKKFKKAKKLQENEDLMKELNWLNVVSGIINLYIEKGIFEISDFGNLNYARKYFDEPDTFHIYTGKWDITLKLIKRINKGIKDLEKIRGEE